MNNAPTDAYGKILSFIKDKTQLTSINPVLQDLNLTPLEAKVLLQKMVEHSLLDTIGLHRKLENTINDVKFTFDNWDVKALILPAGVAYLKDHSHQHINVVGDGNNVQAAGHFSSLEMIHNTTAPPAMNETIQPRTISMLKKYWWSFVIPIVVGLVIAYFKK